MTRTTPPLRADLTLCYVNEYIFNSARQLRTKKSCNYSVLEWVTEQTLGNNYFSVSEAILSSAVLFVLFFNYICSNDFLACSPSADCVIAKA